MYAQTESREMKTERDIENYLPYSKTTQREKNNINHSHAEFRMGTYKLQI